MCLRSLRRPGRGTLPWFIQSFLASPPFQCLVVKPNISVLMLHLSSVLPMMSAHIAASVIDLPLIEPELSINIETTVSLKFISDSCLKLSAEPGLVTILVSLAVSSNPSSRLKFQLRFCWACRILCSRLASLPMV